MLHPFISTSIRQPSTRPERSNLQACAHSLIDAFFPGISDKQRSALLTPAFLANVAAIISDNAVVD